MLLPIGLRFRVWVGVRRFRYAAARAEAGAAAGAAAAQARDQVCWFFGVSKGAAQPPPAGHTQLSQVTLTAGGWRLSLNDRDA
jgi:hypothetical protein